jgi:YjbE family integral membrane protein
MLDFFLGINWLTVGQIILIDILLGGDNAIVIALACRNLPETLRMRGILWGTLGAILSRILLLIFASALLELSFVKLIAGILLYYIAIKLSLDVENDDKDIHASERLITAIKTIVLADLIMSIDNVVAVAGIVQHSQGSNQLAMMIFGILVSIPFVVWGSTLVIQVVERFPSIVTIGAGMLAYIAGAMICTDLVVVALLKHQISYLSVIIPLLHVKLNLIGVIGVISIFYTTLIAGKKRKLTS